MIEKPGKLRSAVLGGLIVGVISGVPGLSLLNCCCCAGILLGGALAVYFYKQEFTDDMPPIESSDALILGIVAGIIGAIIAGMVGTIATFILGEKQIAIGKYLMDKVESKGSVPQELIDKLRNQMEQAVIEARTIGGILRTLIFNLILYPIFSMLGGLIGFGIFGKRKPPLHQQPPAQG